MCFSIDTVLLLCAGMKGDGIRTNIILGIIAVRYVLLPTMGTFIVKAGIHLGLVHSDPLFQFVLLLQYALPPAMNIGIFLSTSIVRV